MSSGIRGTRARLALLVAVLGLSAGLVACDDEEGGATAVATGTPGLGTGIDRETILGEVEQVRAMFAQSSMLDAQILEDVTYEDGRLRVILGADATGADTTANTTADAVAQAEQVCDDLARAMQLPDLQISVHSPGGEELAACQLRQ